MGYLPLDARAKNDAYYTSPALASAIVKRLAGIIDNPVRIIEPSAGKGSFIRAARAEWPNAHIIGLDINEQCKDLIKGAGADEVVIGSWDNPSLEIFKEPFDLILGNPPYLYAESHIKIAKEHLKEGGYLAFLLRMSFLSTQKRVKRLWQHPSELRYLLPMAERCSFFENGGHDNSEYSSFIWVKGYTGYAEILPHCWTKE